MAEQKILPKETDEQNKLKEFWEKFTALSKEYGYDVGAKIEVSTSSIEAVPFIYKIKKENVQSK